MHQVIGRFAPSPTGPLHVGSLVAAVASYCQAKAQGGQWLLRIEDVDQSRCHPAFASSMIETLATYGFVWDGEIVYQSQRQADYQSALDRLITTQQAYPCSCSRKEIADSSQRIGIEGAIYPGTCLHKTPNMSTPLAWRVRTPNHVIAIEDALQGKLCHHLANDIGDFVLKRADGLFTYQLAVVVDDARQQVTQVVRGADLLNSTTRQVYLQQALGYASPQYAHIPLVTNSLGQKLSKQTLAQALPLDNIVATLQASLACLQRTPPVPSQIKRPDHLLQWAIEHWQSYF